MRILSLLFLITCMLCNINSLGKNHSLENDFESLDVKEKVRILGDSCWGMREFNSLEAIRIGEEAINLAKNNNLNKEIARLSNFLGVIHLHYLHEIKEGISYLHQALEVSSLEKDSVQMGFVYNNLGDAFLLTGNTTLSLEYSKLSFNIFKQINDSLGMAYGHVNIGSVYRKDGDYENAISEFQKAKQIRNLLKDELGSASILLEIANTYYAQGKIEDALKIFKDSYDFHVRIRNVLYTALCLNGIANGYYNLDRIDEASDAYEEAIRLFKIKNHKAGLIDAYLGLALVHAKNERTHEGEGLLQKSLILAKTYGMTDRILKVHKFEVHFYRIIGNYLEAVKSSEKHFEVFDSVLSRQKFETLYELQKNYSTQFNLELANQEVEASKLKQWLLTVFIALLFLIILGVVWKMRTHRRMNQILKEHNLSKDKLFSVISHDLKGPFNSILGFSEVLKEELENGSTEDAKKYSEIINSSAKENLNLLNNLLNWSRSQTDRISYQEEDVNVKALFEELKKLYDIEGTKNNISLQYQSDILSSIKADPNILKIILSNLISNALKYTNDGGRIEISAKVEDLKVVFKISDNGIGMSREYSASLLNSNQGISKVGVRNEQGTGLGLMICKELIQLHQGSIEVDSELGKGTSFKVTIPYKY